MPVLHFGIVDTRPGAGDGQPFSPPADWTGSSEDYMKLMRTRFRQMPAGLYMLVQSRHVAQCGAVFEGAFANEARSIIERLKPKNKEEMLKC